jgi:hypothetical protein
MFVNGPLMSSLTWNAGLQAAGDQAAWESPFQLVVRCHMIVSNQNPGPFGALSRIAKAMSESATTD